MTTLIGIKSNSGTDSIVLASDYQYADYDEDDRQLRRKSYRKLFFADGGSCVFGSDGVDRTEVRNFLGVLRGYKRNDSTPEKAREILERAINSERKIFQEVVDLNQLLKREDVPMTDLPSFLLAINKSNLQLLRVDQYGNIKEPSDKNEFDYVCLGSGSETAQEYIQQQMDNRVIDREKITTRVAMRLARGATLAAERDPGSGMGYDIVVVTQKNIKSYGEEIRENLIRADEKKLELLADIYEPPKEENDKP